MIKATRINNTYNITITSNWILIKMTIIRTMNKKMPLRNNNKTLNKSKTVVALKIKR